MLGYKIGDGRLNPTGEKIIETCCPFGDDKGPAMTFDYPFTSSRAYNRVRGPAKTIIARRHAQV